MDQQLQDRLHKWRKQIDVVRKAEELLFNLEASEKALFGKLFLGFDGKTVQERESKAYSSEVWKEFKRGLAAAKAKHNYEKRMLELKVKAYEAVYLQYKIDNDYLRRPS